MHQMTASETHRLRAQLCEKHAADAYSGIIKGQLEELAMEWHLLAKSAPTDSAHQRGALV